jgi:lipoprotein-anchoring transpeptidase ErfK/SrfK
MVYQSCFFPFLTCLVMIASPPIQRLLVSAFVILSAGAAAAQQPPMPTTPPMVVMPPPPPVRTDLGGGFIEFLFGARGPQPQVAAPPPNLYQAPAPIYVNAPPVDPMLEQGPPGFHMDPRFLRQEVAYAGKEEPGTLVIDTPNHFLYLVEQGGKALRYGIGVGRPGFTWSGQRKVSAKKEWPDWVPPKEMLERQPGLPHFMAGGPNNPLGARALYLGSTLYRIHGSNEPWTIGHNVSSGCIRMRNVDVIDLYDRVKVGAKVVVL